MSILNLIFILNSFFPGTEKQPQYLFPADSVKFIEKVYLHIDRDRYSPGDEIWFKAYLIDGSEKLLTDHSNNLHVDLISPDSKIVESHVIRIFGGLGKGDFRLPDKIRSGQYRIRAYTNYMRNFSDQFFFNKVISVINPADSAGFNHRYNIIDKNKPDVGFFPEGGSLVDNVMSVIGFKALDIAGNSCDVTGIIYTSAGNKVVDFKSSFKGMGTFVLTPVRGEEYHAVIKDLYGDSVVCRLPAGFRNGLVMNLSNIKEGVLEVTIRTNDETLHLLHDQDLRLIASSHNIAFNTISFQLKSVNNYLVMNTRDLPEGIIALTIEDQNEKPLCERLAFIHNKSDVNIRVEADRNTYNIRDSVSVRVSLSGKSETGKNVFLSLAAVDNVATEGSSKYRSTIASWFLLESELRGEIEDPSYYFDLTNEDRYNQLDILLLTQGWRDFKWKYENIHYHSEYGFDVSGKVRRLFADEPLNNSTVNVGIFKDGKPSIFTIPTDTSGRFSLNRLDFTGDVRLIASATNDRDKLKGWLQLDSISYVSAMIEPVRYKSNSLIHNIFYRSSYTPKNNVDIYRIYSEQKDSLKKLLELEGTINAGEVIIKPKSRLIPETPKEKSVRYLMTRWPDKEIKITSMEEIYNTVGQYLIWRQHIFYSDDPQNLVNQFRPKKIIVDELGGRKIGYGGDLSSGGSGAANLMSKATANLSGSHMVNPLTMLDGMVVGYEGVSFIPMSWVERIDILYPIQGEMIWGRRGSNGVVSVLLKDEAYTGKDFTAYHSVNVKLKGYNEPRLFYSPRHNRPKQFDSKPDLRTTLFWGPDIKLEEGKGTILSYYNADNPATVRIVAEGITSSGIPVFGETEYKVE